ncbi:hypothetical protein DID88_010034 [Monilinia fructigena]|uniref:Uncharacterized protein n=1 Tax=Monilinia fructigena TaxID=38457 RepID=A0A395ILA9_9HELO|nr:hypothetical protein DID88_010034 [Monilinia fructigena]
MDVFANQFPKFQSPFQSTEGSSFQIQADYTNRDGEKIQTQTASLKINVQTLKVLSVNYNATDDAAMSGLE